MTKTDVALLSIISAFLQIWCSLELSQHRSDYIFLDLLKGLKVYKKGHHSVLLSHNSKAELT